MWYLQQIASLMPSHFFASFTGYQCTNVCSTRCCTRWLYWCEKLASPMSWHTSTSIWLRTSLSAVHILLHCLCWLYQNWSLSSLGAHFVTLHSLLGIIFPSNVLLCNSDLVFKQHLKKFLFNTAWLSAVQCLCSSAYCRYINMISISISISTVLVVVRFHQP